MGNSPSSKLSPEETKRIMHHVIKQEPISDGVEDVCDEVEDFYEDMMSDPDNTRLKDKEEFKSLQAWNPTKPYKRGGAPLCEFATNEDNQFRLEGFSIKPQHVRGVISYISDLEAERQGSEASRSNVRTGMRQVLVGAGLDPALDHKEDVNTEQLQKTLECFQDPEIYLMLQQEPPTSTSELKDLVTEACGLQDLKGSAINTDTMDVIKAALIKLNLFKAVDIKDIKKENKDLKNDIEALESVEPTESAETVETVESDEPVASDNNVVCSDITDETECTAQGCAFVDGTCS